MEMQPNFFFDVFEPNHYQNGPDVLNQEQIPYNSRYGLGDQADLNKVTHYSNHQTSINEDKSGDRA